MDGAAIFASAGDGIVVNDLETGLIIEVNPAFCAMRGLAREAIVDQLPTTFIHPDDQSLFTRYLESIRANEAIRISVRVVRADGDVLPVEIHGTRLVWRGRHHALGIVRDTTAREAAGRLWEAQFAERTRELSLLVDVSRSIASTLELGPLLDVIMTQVQAVAPVTGATVLLREDDEVVVIGDYGSATGRHASFVGLRIPLARAAMLWERIGNGEPVIIDDVREPTPLSAAYREVAGPLADSSFSYIRSWMGIPMVHKDQVIGVLTIAHGTPAAYTTRHAELVLATARQAAVAIINARLYNHAQQETRRTAALARVAASLATAGPLENVLEDLAATVVETTRAQAAAVYLADGDLTTARLTGAHGLPAGYATAIEDAMHQGKMTFDLATLDEHQPLVRHNVWQTYLASPDFVALQRFAGLVSWDTAVVVPLVARGRKLGLLATYYHHSQAPDESEQAFLVAIASQAAVAIDTARLYLEAQDKAVLEERTRLAHDLHDSATQTVFSLGMLARAARAQHDQRSDKLPATLERIATLAQEALAELRSLLFELRPDALTDGGLGAALPKLVAGFETRTNLVARYHGATAARLTPEAELAMFRIVQEALGNAGKHAQAKVVDVEVREQNGSLAVVVRDDGVGFDPSAPVRSSQDGRQGGQGVRSMRERAAAAGLTLTIESRPRNGTTVRAEAPLPRGPASIAP
jgi:PAS domain S-box-containing protein